MRRLLLTLINTMTLRCWVIRQSRAWQKAIGVSKAASVSLANTDLSLEHGIANRAWFYKAPEGEWKLLQDSVSSLPSCKIIEADSDAKKHLLGSKCWDVKKENGTTTREVRISAPNRLIGKKLGSILICIASIGVCSRQWLFLLFPGYPTASLSESDLVEVHSEFRRSDSSWVAAIWSKKMVCNLVT